MEVHKKIGLKHRSPIDLYHSPQLSRCILMEINVRYQEEVAKGTYLIHRLIWYMYVLTA